MYRVYCKGFLEFGIDYATLEAARIAKDDFARHFPALKYYIRKVA